jgi:hypothetical protein
MTMQQRIDLTQAGARARFELDDRGIVQSPGMFHGQPAYLTWMWELCQLGRVHSIRGVFYCTVYPEDVEEWPELAGKKEIRLRKLENGQVVVVED